MFNGSINFSAEIEKRVKSSKLSYIDAVIDVCETLEIEPQAIAKFLSKTVTEKIKIEATARNLIRGKKKEKIQRLPL